MGYVNDTLKLTAVDEKLRRERNRFMAMQALKGKIIDKSMYGDLDLALSGSPIEVNDGIRVKGIGNKLPIPMQLQYTGNGVMGGAVLEGNEEEDAVLWSYVHYNTRRHAIRLDKGQQYDTEEDFLKLKASKAPMLGDWAAKMENWDIISALYEGVSENLSTATSSGGLGLARRFHPNTLFWYGTTQETGSLNATANTAGTFPTAAYLGLKYDDSIGATVNAMTTYTLENTVEQLLNKNIKKIANIYGEEFWLMYVSPLQARQLRADSAFKAAMNYYSGYKDMTQNPMLKGSIGFYNGIAIRVAPVDVRGMKLTGSTGSWTDVNYLGTGAQQNDENYKNNPRFMPMTGHTGSATNTVHCAFVLGQSALGEAVGVPLHYEQNSKDYNDVKGIAAVEQYGYERLDYVSGATLKYLEETPGSCTGVKNDSSMIIVTGEV